jgi:hypothetical protein
MRKNPILKRKSDIWLYYHFTPAQMAELDKRSNEYKNGIGRTYTWEETVAAANQALIEIRKKINKI